MNQKSEKSVTKINSSGWRLIIFCIVILCIFIVLLLIAGCTYAAAENSSSLESITINLGGGVFPKTEIANKEITLYPDGKGELKDYLWPEAPEESQQIAREYSFLFSQETFTELEEAVSKNKFFSLPADLGVYATDIPYDSITVKAENKTHTSAGAGISLNNLSNNPFRIKSQAKRWSSVEEAFWTALDSAYFDQADHEIDSVTCTLLLDKEFWEGIGAGITYGYSPKQIEEIKDINIWETSLYSDGRKTTAEYEPFSELVIDFPRNQAVMIEENHYYYDPESFRKLAEVIMENNFFLFPQEFIAAENGEPIKMIGDSTIWLTVTLNGQTYTSGCSTTQQYAFPEFMNVYLAFEEAADTKNMISLEKQMIIQEIFQNWDM